MSNTIKKQIICDDQAERFPVLQASLRSKAKNVAAERGPLPRKMFAIKYVWSENVNKRGEKIQSES